MCWFYWLESTGNGSNYYYTNKATKWTKRYQNESFLNWSVGFMEVIILVGVNGNGSKYRDIIKQKMNKQMINAHINGQTHRKCFKFDNNVVFEDIERSK